MINGLMTLSTSFGVDALTDSVNGFLSLERASALIRRDFVYFQSWQARQLNGRQIENLSSFIWQSARRLFCRRLPAELLHDVYAQTRNNNNNSVDNSGYFVERPPVPVDADKLALPERAGNVPLLSLLAPVHATAFADPYAWLLPVPPRSLPKPFLHVKRGGYLAVVRRLFGANMISFTTRKPLAVNGLFAVRKSDGSDRLIVDARPAGALCSNPPAISLANPELIALLRAEGRFSVAKEDFETYFYQLLVPESWWPLFGLPAVSAAEFGLGEGLVYPVLKAAHQNLLYSMTSLRPCDEISLLNDFALDRLRHIVIFDDLNLFDPDPSGRNAARFLREYYAVCERFGLRLNATKRVCPTTECRSAGCRSARSRPVSRIVP